MVMAFTQWNCRPNLPFCPHFSIKFTCGLRLSFSTVGIYFQGQGLFVILFCLNEAICHDHKKRSRISECFGVSNSAINHGKKRNLRATLEVVLKRSQRSNQVFSGLLFLCKTLWQKQSLFFFIGSSLILKLLGKKREGHTNEH